MKLCRFQPLEFDAQNVSRSGTEKLIPLRALESLKAIASPKFRASSGAPASAPENPGGSTR